MSADRTSLFLLVPILKRISRDHDYYPYETFKKYSEVRRMMTKN